MSSQTDAQALSLEAAIAQGNLTAVRALLDANPEALEQRFQDNVGLSPLMWACRCRQEAIVEGLLQRGADVNTRNRVETNGEGGNFALWFTANGYAPNGSGSSGLPIARRLVESGADINMAGEFGETPLHQAAAWNQRDTVAYLIQSGAIINAKTESGQTPLALAEKHGFTEVAEMLQQHNAL